MTTRFVPWIVRSTALCFAAGVALGGWQSRHDAAPLGWLAAPVAHAGALSETCCEPAVVRIHTNATAGTEDGPFLNWRSVHGQFVPVDFRVIYQRIGQVGSQTISMPGRLNADGTVSFTPPTGFRAVEPCFGPTPALGDIVTLIDVFNFTINDGPCATAGREPSLANLPCFTDTDWRLRLARRVAGPPASGSMMGTSWEFKAVAANINVTADDGSLFTQTDPADPEDCDLASDRRLVSNSERITQQTLPGPGQIICGDEVALCLYAAFE